MKGDNHEKIIDVFNSALTLDQPGREAFVEKNLEDDKIARDEVFELLKSYDNANDFLAETPSKLAADAIESLDPKLRGKKIGAYEIEKQIGFGGMGTVYLATRADKQFDQKVAIKLLKRGMDTDQIVQRFKYERQILAELNHPNIAKLLDGGTTEKGLPYFVLEYIEGLPITDYCAKLNLDLHSRLQLFREVCSAISYAHQNLVVHRDIKPGNILVTSDGTSKLLDFGIAKVLQSGATVTELTTTGERLMTPKYASPEQVRGGQITTASDVYGLGVLFYELLTGKLPYNLESKSPLEIDRIICETDPSRPSQETGNIGTESTPNVVSHNPKLIKGDLDNIALMALEKDPDKRYSSVDDFSADIRNYLKGLPVTARAHTYFYRATKFAKRNVIGVAVGLLIFALLMGFAITSQIQANRIELERDRSEKVVAFMSEIFEGNDPENAKGKEVSARELLDKGIIKIRNEFGDQPDVQAALMNTVGSVYSSIGLYDKAETLLKEALAKRRDFFGSESNEVAETLAYLGRVQGIKANYADSEKNLLNSVEIRERLFGKTSKEILPTLTFMVETYYQKNDQQKAENIAVRISTIIESLHGLESKEMVKSLNDISEIQLFLDADKGIATARQSIAISEKISENPHDGLIQAKVILARLLFFKKQEYLESKKLLDDSITMAESVYGEAHPKTAKIYRHMSQFYSNQGKHIEAIEIIDKSIAVTRKVFGNEHQRVAYVLNQKAAALYHLGRLNDAETYYIQAIEIYKRVLGEGHPMLTQTLSNVGLLKYDQKKYREAALTFRRSLKIQRDVMHPRNPQIGFTLIGLGKSLIADNKAKQAEAHINEGIKLLENSAYADTFYVWEARNIQGSCFLAIGKYKKAEPILRMSFNKIRKRYGPQHKKTNIAKGYLVELYKKMGNSEEERKYRDL